MKYKSNPEPEVMEDKPPSEQQQHQQQQQQQQQQHQQQQQQRHQQQFHPNQFNQAPPPPPSHPFSQQMQDYHHHHHHPTMFNQHQPQQPPIGNNFRTHPQAPPSQMCMQGSGSPGPMNFHSQGIRNNEAMFNGELPFSFTLKIYITTFVKIYNVSSKCRGVNKRDKNSFLKWLWVRIHSTLIDTADMQSELTE